MQAQNPARRHHYVPQFYLRAFAGSDGKIWQYKREPCGHVSERHVSPKATGFEENLYAVREVATFLPERDPVGIESTFLASIDDAAAPVHRKLLEKPCPTLSDAERTAWATFLNSMLERDLRVIREREELAPKFTESVTSKLRSRARTMEDLARLDDTLQSLDCEAISLNSVREHMVREIRDPKTLDILQRRGWRLVRLGQGPDLVTSDAPLSINAGTDSRPIELLACALSPSCLFVMYPSHWPADQEFKDLCQSLVLIHNLTMIDGPGRFLYSRDRILDDDGGRLRAAVERRFGARRQPAPLHE